MLGGVLVAIPDMTTGMDFASRAALARSATHACEVALPNDRIGKQDLLTEPYVRPICNLYPHFSLKSVNDRTRFLEKYNE